MATQLTVDWAFGLFSAEQRNKAARLTEAGWESQYIPQRDEVVFKRVGVDEQLSVDDAHAVLEANYQLLMADITAGIAERDAQRTMRFAATYGLAINRPDVLARIKTGGV